MSEGPEISDTLSAAEAAKILGVSAQTIRVRCQKGQLAGVKIVTDTGPQWRVFRVGPFAPDAAEAAEQHLPPGGITGMAPRAIEPGIESALALVRDLGDEVRRLAEENARLREQLATRPPLALPPPAEAPPRRWSWLRALFRSD